MVKVLPTRNTTGMLKDKSIQKVTLMAEQREIYVVANAAWQAMEQLQIFLLLNCAL